MSLTSIVGNILACAEVHAFPKMNVIKSIQIVVLFTCQNIVLALRTSSDEKITLLTFDGAPDTTYKFHQDNDPIMVCIISNSS